jgi:hypothetical protein
MKFIRLGFHDEANRDEKSKSFNEQSFAYDDELSRGGHFLGGEALQPAQDAASVRCRSGQVVVTDGPFAETKEHVGGILCFRADRKMESSNQPRPR